MTPEITKTEDQTPKTKGWFVWVFFGFLIVFVYFFGLTIPFLGPDEPRYAQIAREMLDRGDWITPTLGGSNWFEKPPLLYWLEMLSYKLFGVSEFAARLGPALFGLGTIASLWILGSFVSDNSKTEDRKPKTDFANYTALIGASTLGIMVFSRGASIDIVITFPITAALVSFFIWHSKNETAPRTLRAHISTPLIFFYVFTGIGLLAKGLIGMIFPFAIIAVFYLFLRRLPSRTFVVSLLWGTFLAVAIASVWYLPMYQRHGYQFIDEFFIQHHFQRFTSNKYQHPQPIYFFFWVVPLMTLPWLPFFLASIWSFAKKTFRHKATKHTKISSNGSLDLLHPSSSLLLFSAAWLVVPLVFFSFSSSKLPGYILPAVPAAVVLTSIFIYDLVRNSYKWRNAILLVAGSTFGAGIVLLTFAVPRFAESDSVKTLIQTAKEHGFVSNRVLMLHTISHNAEFYAADRLLRDAEGKQLYLSGVGEVIKEIDAEKGRDVLVLVPPKYLSQLSDNEKLKTEVLNDNGDLAIAAVSFR